MKPGSLLIDHSANGQAIENHAAALMKGIKYLDAPISSALSSEKCEKQRLIMMIGGDKDAVY